MKRKLLAITLTLAMLASLFSVASISVAADTENLVITPVTEMPNGNNLLQGMYPAAGVSGQYSLSSWNSSAYPLTNLVDGNLETAWRGFSSSGYKIFFNLGTTAEIESFLVGSFCEGGETGFRINKVKIYVSDTIVDKWSLFADKYLAINATSMTALHNVLSVTGKTFTAACVGFDITGSYAVSSGQTFFGELGAYGTPAASFADTQVTAITELPEETNLLSGLTPKRADGTSALGKHADTDGADSTLVNNVLGDTTPWGGWFGNQSRIVFDLGDVYKLNKFLIGSVTCDGHEYVRFADIYVGNNVNELFTADSLVLSSAGHTKGLPLSRDNVLNSKSGKTWIGRYVAFDFDNNEMTVSASTDDVGGYMRYFLRLAELGVYGEKITRTAVDSLDDLPEGKSLIAGKVPTKADGGAISMNSGSLANITDGKMQGVDQTVKFLLSQDESAKTATYKGVTYYSWIASPKMLEDYGMDPTETWYLVPENLWLKCNHDEQRGVLANTSQAGGQIVYDMITENTVESILLASSIELNGLQNGNTSGTHQVISDSQYASMNGVCQDNRLLWTAKVYVGNDKATIFNAENLVLEYDLSANYPDALRNLWTLPEAATGRYVAFDFNDCVMSSSNTLVRISELGVYGSSSVTTYSADELTASIPAADGNILKNALEAKICSKTDTATGNPYTNAKLTGVLVDGIVDGANDKKHTPGTDAEGYIYVTYDLETAYDIDSVYYAGDGSDGANSVAVYVGNQTIAEIVADSVAPDYFYDGGIGDKDFVTNNCTNAQAIRFEFDETLTGRYVTFRLATCKNGNSNMVWIGEFAASGSPVTIHTGGAQLRNTDANGNYAVRFGFHMATDTIGYVDETHADNNYARAALDENSMTTVNGKNVQVVDFGAVVSNQTDMTADGLTLEACSNETGSQVKKVTAANLYAVKDGYITYTAVVTGIPASYADSDLYARPYIQYMDGDNVVTIYGDMFTACASDYIVIE